MCNSNKLIHAANEISFNAKRYFNGFLANLCCDFIAVMVQMIQYYEPLHLKLLLIIDRMDSTVMRRTELFLNIQLFI